ncbi:MAG: EthD family reductase [Thaumarchaeota archaeon]|nr:EthD family reductase [Nitrososphaerota archaeon]
MLKAICLIRKKPELSFQDFREYLLKTHAPNYGKKLPGLKRYVVNIVTGGYMLEERPCDGIAELEFADEESFLKAMESPEGRAAAEDLMNVAEKVDVVFLEEKVVKKPRPKPAKKKVAKKAKKVKRKKAAKRKVKAKRKAKKRTRKKKR